MRFLDDEAIVLWACRAVNNLCKSAKIRTIFLGKDIMEVIDAIEKAHAYNAEILEWVNLTRDTLNS